MKTLGVGMVGYGFMGKVHTYGYKSLPMLYEPAPAAIRLVGAATRTEESGRLAVEQGGYEFSTRDYHDLLARDDIDVINCCVPNNLHKEVVVDAIRAGRHIYVDKPLALNLEQAKEIVHAEAEAEAAGSHSARQMAHNYRFVPAIMRAKQLMDEGRLGRIYTFALRYLHSSNVDPNRPLHWKSDKAVGGGGVLVDLGSHIIDMTRFLLGDFKRVCANPVTPIEERPNGIGGTVRVETDDVCYVLAELQNGAVGTLEASKMATGANDELTVEIRGSNGAILFNLMDPNWLSFYDNTLLDAPLGGEKGFLRIECVQRYPKPAAIPGPKLTVGWTRFHFASIYEFVRRVVEGEPGEPSLSDGLATHQVIEACYNSPGVWVSL
ncbi:MAG: Gfo/Idh/MocA family oxidoreductase [Armatimonadota bacterium]|nr:Gfo/Idh/MocA family oxidoreductase [Armatimonadota bacterium]